jgi:hypothetical protein
VKHSESLDKLLPALIAAKAKFRAVRKDGYNPHFKSKFASLKAVQEATSDSLSENGLTILQFPSTVDGKPALTTWLAHTSGQYVADETVLSLAKSDPQAQGSAITYLRRYSWSSVLGLVTDEDDDDGNTASAVAKPKTLPQSQQEMNRLVSAAKRAGKTKEEVESLFLKKHNTPLASAANEDVTAMADWLTEQAVTKELA